jgi:hypothetical protein
MASSAASTPAALRSSAALAGAVVRSVSTGWGDGAADHRWRAAQLLDRRAGRGDAARFGKALDLDAIRRVPVYLAIGGADSGTWEITITPADAWWTGATGGGA